MRYLPILLLFLLVSPLVALQGVGASAKGGVKSGSTWKNNTQEVDVCVRGTIHGNQEVTVTQNGKTGKGTGTPHKNGGCKDSSTITVGGEKFRVKNSTMQHKNSKGKWTNMHQPPGGGDCDCECDPDDADAVGI